MTTAPAPTTAPSPAFVARWPRQTRISADQPKLPVPSSSRARLATVAHSSRPSPPQAPSREPPPRRRRLGSSEPAAHSVVTELKGRPQGGSARGKPHAHFGTRPIHVWSTQYAELSSTTIWPGVTALVVSGSTGVAPGARR